MKVGQLVIVAYPGKKTNTTNYIGKISEVMNRCQLLNIMFLRRQPGSNVFMYPASEDIDPAVPSNYVMKVLREPTLNSRLQMTFEGNDSILLK